MAATLQLLHGPTKALVGSALTGLAADLALHSSNPALCYVQRPAYDDDAFQGMYGTMAQQALASPKPKRPVGVVALARLGTPSHLAFTFGRNVGLTALVTLNRWLLAALDEEERAEAEGREPEMPPLTTVEVAAACRRGAHNACVDLAVQSTRALLDARAVQALPAELAGKMVKDLRQSAVRKGRLAWYIRAPRVARTAAFSEATWWAADFLVSCVQEAYALLLKAGGPWQQRLRRLALRCALHAARSSLVLGAVAVGNGVGSASPRLRGLAMWLASLGASFLVNAYMLALMNRWAPAGGGGPATGGAAAAPPPRQPRQQGREAGGSGGGGGIVLVGQAVQPAAAAAVAAAAAAGAGVGEEAAANGPAEAAQAFGAAAAAEQLAAEQAAEAEAGAEAGAPVAAQQQDAGVQAAVGDAAEPPIPAPQQRRVVGGPRLPDRPARRNAAAGPDAAAAPQAGAGQPPGPPPAAPATPQFRTDQRAPTPAGDSEEAEVRAAAAAGSSPSAGAGTSGASSTSRGSEAPGSASPPTSGSSRPRGAGGRPQTPAAP